MTGLGDRYPSNRVARSLGTPDCRAVILPIDDSLIGGPAGGLRRVDALASAALSAPATSLLGFAGQFAAIETHDRNSSLGRIVNVTASVVGPDHTRKRQVYTVEHALVSGADAVAAHVNLTSRHEGKMLETLGHVIQVADSLGMPTVAIVYPRTERADGSDDNYSEIRENEPEEYESLVARCVRLGADLGAAAVKTQFSGSISSFDEICRQNPRVRVLAAGGPKLALEDALGLVRAVANTSAAGISFGRNSFNRTDVVGFIRACRRILDEGTATASV